MSQLQSRDREEAVRTSFVQQPLKACATSRTSIVARLQGAAVGFEPTGYRSPGVTRSEQGAPVVISVPDISAYSGRPIKKDLCALMKIFCKAALHAPMFASARTEFPTRTTRISFFSSETITIR